jgi:uncharacterized protein YdiU (UPF0061 family)
MDERLTEWTGGQRSNGAVLQESQLRVLQQLHAMGRLAAMGVTDEMVQAEVAKFERSKVQRSQTAEEKAASDRKLWTEWAGVYSRRILAELQASGEGGAAVDYTDEVHERRRRLADSANPKFVLRQWIAQFAIERAEVGDRKAIDSLMEILRRPFDEHPDFEFSTVWSAPPPAAADDICVT